MASDNSKYRHLTAGEATILEIIDENPDMQGWLESLQNSLFQQCKPCSALTFESLKKGHLFRASWDQVKETALNGCHTCRFLYFARMGCKKMGSTLYQSAPQPIELRLEWAQLSAGYEVGQRICCGIGLIPDIPPEKCKEEINGKVASRFVEDDPSSGNAFALARNWISNCLTKHEYCLNNQRVELPTRVIDIGEYKTVGRAFLFISGGLKSTYLALSHCWGKELPDDGSIRRCTTKNFEQLKAGFQVSQLPRNFREAISVADKLGVQYVWIDSLCIIQDQDSDWSHESALMSRVYGNSHITIYASAAANTDAGFLQRRPQSRYVRTKVCRIPNSLDRWIWAQWPSSELVWSMEESNGPLWNRAWAFQELILPPRVLEYSPISMKFRCNTELHEESSRFHNGGCHDGYKELMWIMALPDIINSPSLEHDWFATRNGERGSRLNVYMRWYDLVQGFAGRQLTVETNKLPAIAGIADKIRQITGDTYMAGLWKNDIATGLCWGIKTNAFPTKFTAPSWSWASTIGYARYQLPEDRNFDVELVDWEIEADPLNILGEVTRGFITIRAPVRPFDVSKDTVHSCEEWDNTVGKVRVNVKRTENRSESYGYEHLFPFSDQKDILDPRGGGICTIWFDSDLGENLKQVLLVDLKAEGCNIKLHRPSSGIKVEGVVLQEALSKNSEVTGVAEYKRIGIWGRYDTWAEWLREGEESAVLQGWKMTEITII